MSTDTKDRTAIITVTHVRSLAGNHVTSACGRTFKYLHTMEKPHFAVLIECLCADGHGISHLPRRYWLTRKDADFDVNFADLTPKPSGITPNPNVPSLEDVNIIPIDVLETLELDQIADVADTYRRTAQPVAA